VSAGYRLVRPWPVLVAQVRYHLWWWATFLTGDLSCLRHRLLTYTEERRIVKIGVLWSVHYVQIGLTNGHVFYASPHLTTRERRLSLLRMERIRRAYLQMINRKQGATQ